MATISATDNHSNVAARITARIERAFHQEEIDGLRLAARVRAVAMIAIAIWLFSLMGTFAWYYMPFLAVFILTAFANYGLAKSSYGRAWQTFALHAFDVGLLTFILLVPNPLLVSAVDYQWPLATQFRFENFLWYFVLIALAALGSYSPRVLRPDRARGTGQLFPACPALGRCGVHHSLVDWVLLGDDDARYPDRRTDVRKQPGAARAVSRPQLSIGQPATAGSNRHDDRGVDPGGYRLAGALARYFPPNMVDQLAEADNPFGEVRSQSVAVLFADIVGFTQMAEQVSPREIVEMLRAYHRRTERLVFENNGTLDKFLGDGVMATFGNPTEGAHDAGDALACARALIAEADDWNKRREASGFPAVRLSVGVHFGPVVRGDIGTERRLEYAVLGDTVNVTSRLEELTRDLHCAIAASGELVAKVRASGDPRAEDLLAGFVKGEPQRLRGREALTEFWTYGSDAQF
jgi:adenylate cyclase